VDQANWQIGDSKTVAWIATSRRNDRTIATAIPPIYDAYATVVTPESDADKQVSDEALLDSLRACTPRLAWWLGYLETGVADVIFPSAPRTQLYWGWPYVLVKAGPDQARSWRTNADATPWHSAIPELIFPLDRSWLVSALWDDDWKCVGGPASLIETILGDDRLDARAVAPGQDVTPPGFENR